MIRIAICDDEKRFIDQLRTILVSYGEDIEETILVQEYQDGVMLLDKYDCKFDIIFLDIRMPYVDGVEVAEKIREKDSDVTIIFLTSLLARAVDGYRVNAANYLIKPVDKKKVVREIDRWIENNREEKQECLLIENTSGQYRIPISSLRYIETYNRNLLLHSKDKSIVCYKKLRDLKEKLEKYGFAQSHKGFLINLSYVDTVNGGDVTLVTKEVLPVSRIMKKEFMEQLARYWGGRL